MKVSNVRKGLMLVIAASALGLGCELIVDFDRTKIPVEGNDGAVVTPDGSFDATFDTSVPDAAEGGDGGAACSTLAFLAPAVEIQNATGAPPDPTGGTLPPGTYALTGMTQYNAGANGPTGTTLRLTTAITTNAFTLIEASGTSDGGVISSKTENGTYVVMGTADASAIVRTLVCPVMSTATLPYSVADGGAVHLYSPPGTVQVYTKQP